MRERPDHEARGLNRPAIREAPRLWPDALRFEGGGQSRNGAESQVIGKYLADEVSLLGYDLRLLVDTAVAERDRPADPQPLAFGGRDLVPDPLPDDLAFELREGEKNVQRQPSHARSRIE